MQLLEVSGAVRYIYIYAIRRIITDFICISLCLVSSLSCLKITAVINYFVFAELIRTPVSLIAVRFPWPLFPNIHFS